MKILVLNYEFPPIGGGGGTASEDISAYYAKLGHTVTILTMGFHDLPEFERSRGIDIVRLDCGRKKIASCSPIEQLRYIIKAEAYIDHHREIQDYDVCHAHFIVPTGEVAYRIKERYNIPYVVTAHGSDVEGHNTKPSIQFMHLFLRRRWKAIVKNAGAVISPSKHLKELMEENCSDGKYSIIPNGIDYGKYKNIAKSGRKEKKILILGRLQRFKNVQFILSVFSKLRLSDWTVEIVGDGPYREELEKAARQLNLSDSVHFHGWIDHEDKQMEMVLAESSIYISASRFENCPMGVIEATTAGCYPLVSDIPAHREMLSPEHLFRLDDENDLKDKLAERVKHYQDGFESDTYRFALREVAKEYIGVLQRESGL